MNERKALLAAIQVAPDDDMPRLAFADWLDEHVEHERDRATAAFIRASCLGRKLASNRMPKLAYQWIEDHWKHLVPTVLAKHLDRVVRPGPDGVVASDPVSWVRDGRLVKLKMRLVVSRPPPRGLLANAIWYAMAFDFHRGFLREAQICSFYASGYLLPSLVVDQPIGVLVWVEGGGTRESPISPPYAGVK